MIKHIHQSLFFLFTLLACHALANKNLFVADSLYKMGGLKNLKLAVEAYQIILDRYPNNFQANWKCARACRDYADLAKKKTHRYWKDISIKYGKIGMTHAENAMTIQPNKPEGFWYYALCVGVYSDGVSVVMALKEGLKNKTQESLEKADAIDKTYMDGGPAIALGRFWAMLPWPYKNKKKAIRYYRKYQSITKYKLFKEERLIYIAELLIDSGKPYYAEAKKLLEQAVMAKDNYHKKRAEALLAELTEK